MVYTGPTNDLSSSKMNCFCNFEVQMKMFLNNVSIFLCLPGRSSSLLHVRIIIRRNNEQQSASATTKKAVVINTGILILFLFDFILDL